MASRQKFAWHPGVVLHLLREDDPRSESVQIIGRNSLEGGSTSPREVTPNNDPEQHHDIQRQEEEEDIKDKENDMIANSPPSQKWPSGIFYFRIDEIMGLDTQRPREWGNGLRTVRNGDSEDEDSDNLPGTYCTAIVNHQRVYKTGRKDLVLRRSTWVEVSTM